MGVDLPPFEPLLALALTRRGAAPSCSNAVQWAVQYRTSGQRAMRQGEAVTRRNLSGTDMVVIIVKCFTIFCSKQVLRRRSVC